MRMITAERNRQEANINKQAREILDGQKDAVYAAQFMGDVKPLTNMANQLRALGKNTEAAELETAVDFGSVIRPQRTLPPMLLSLMLRPVLGSCRANLSPKMASHRPFLFGTQGQSGRT